METVFICINNYFSNVAEQKLFHLFYTHVIYIKGHPNTSILRYGYISQASGNNRRHRATTGVGSLFSTRDRLSVFAVNVYK